MPTTRLAASAAAVTVALWSRYRTVAVISMNHASISIAQACAINRKRRAASTCRTRIARLHH